MNDAVWGLAGGQVATGFGMGVVQQKTARERYSGQLARQAARRDRLLDGPRFAFVVRQRSKHAMDAAFFACSVRDEIGRGLFRLAPIPET